jgi:hypothetical protein
MRRSRQFLLAISLTLVMAGCAGEPMDAPAEEAAARARALLPAAAELSRDLPGFGGFFLDADGAPAVYLTPGSSHSSVELAFGDYLSELGLPSTEARVLEGRFEWRQLEGWQGSATHAAFAVDGTILVDNDETRNRIRIGVEDAAAEGRVRAALARAGLPDDAVLIEQVEPIYRVASLQNIVDRPVRAGVQINFPGFLCSVGFNANSGGQRSFITASHCTSKQGGVESTPYFQPLQSVNGTQIGTEVADPAYVRGGAECPRGKTCRRSDAARVVYANGNDQALGVIARTSAPNNGSLEVVGSFSITSDDTNNSIPVGATVDKVGRTTGWTSGELTDKCVNTGVQGSKIVLLCQNFVSAGVGGGDSGSDVFEVVSSTNARLEGILWGGSGAGDVFVYSPLQNVIQELGPLTTH